MYEFKTGDIVTLRQDYTAINSESSKLREPNLFSITKYGEPIDVEKANSGVITVVANNTVNDSFGSISIHIKSEDYDIQDSVHIECLILA